MVLCLRWILPSDFALIGQPQGLTMPANSPQLPGGDGRSWTDALSLLLSVELKLFILLIDFSWYHNKLEAFEVFRVIFIRLLIPRA